MTAVTTASTHVGAPFRPDRRIVVGLLWRALLVVAASVAVALEAPAWLRTPLSAAAALAVAVFFVQRFRRRGVLETWLVAAGGGVVLLALLGLLLNVLPSGLSPLGWGVGAGVLELVILVALALLRPPAARAARAPRSQRAVVAAVGWSALVAGVVAAAVIWSAASFTATHAAPLAMEARPTTGAVVVSVTAGTEEGPYRLELVTDSGRTVLARDVRVGPDRTSTTTVRLPAGARGLVQLVPVDGATPVRELILDSSLQTSTR